MKFTFDFYISELELIILLSDYKLNFVNEKIANSHFIITMKIYLSINET